ncbi:MAG: prepilin-type N-terminal cleavage/methylation domain-containing protein [bacterium]
MNKNNGFTLIELMIVVVIISILASIAIPKFVNLVHKANEGKTKGCLGALRSATVIYYADNQGFPTGLYADDNALANLAPKYIGNIPECHVSLYHQASNAESDESSISSALDNGGWGYDSADANSFTDVDAADYNMWGHVWVGCTHDDLFNNTWSKF